MLVKSPKADRDVFNIPSDVDGVLVTKTEGRGEAAKKGVSAGDVIVEINQQTIKEPKDVANVIKKAQKSKKSSVLLLVNREGDVRFVALKLEDPKKKKKKKKDD